MLFQQRLPSGGCVVSWYHCQSVTLETRVGDDVGRAVLAWMMATGVGEMNTGGSDE